MLSFIINFRCQKGKYLDIPAPHKSKMLNTHPGAPLNSEFIINTQDSICVYPLLVLRALNG